MDDQIPVPSVRAVDPRREAIRDYERMFEEHDRRMEELLPYCSNEIAGFLVELPREARSILASAIVAERGVTRW